MNVVISMGTPDTYKYLACNIELVCFNPIIPDIVLLINSDGDWKIVWLLKLTVIIPFMPRSTVNK